MPTGALRQGVLMAVEGGGTFKEKLVCGFKYDMKNLVNYHSKVQNFLFDGLFLPKVCELQKYRKVVFHDTEEWRKKMNKLWPCGFKNGKRNWVNFHYRALNNLKNCTLTGSFCPKQVMLQLENFISITSETGTGGVLYKKRCWLKFSKIHRKTPLSEGSW